MNNTSRIYFLVSVFCGLSFIGYSQPFETYEANLVNAYFAKIEWVDLDNDNDLDLMYSGFTNGGNFSMEVYENQGGSFISRETGLPNLRNGSFSLGDFDKDGDMDVILSGLSDSGNISDLYENVGGFSFAIKQSFPALFNTSTSWADIDNDEDLDLLIAGENSILEMELMVYENAEGSFNLLPETNLSPCVQCSIAWADYNGDGKLDVVITGFNGDLQPRTYLYVNTGDKSFVKDDDSPLEDVFNGDAKWGDYDNDGDMDLLLSGVMENGKIICHVYKNEGGRLVFQENIAIKGTGENFQGGTKWVDFNNDGLLDIIVSGRGTSIIVLDYALKLYQNLGDGSFEELLGSNLLGFSASSLDFGDFDNDGDVDFCYTGVNSGGPITRIIENKLIVGTTRVNSNPEPPLSETQTENFFRKKVFLVWGEGSDTETPVEGLSYNFYLKSESNNLSTPAANFSTGYLTTYNPPNGQGKTSLLYNLPEGNYSWAVQSIDGSKSASVFTSEKSFFQINGPEAKRIDIIDPRHMELTWLDNSLIESEYVILRSTSSSEGFSEVGILSPDSEFFIDEFDFVPDVYYYYRLYATNLTKDSAYDSLRVVLPKPPTNLVVLPVNSSSISLAWEDKSGYESGYEIQRKKSNESNFESIVILPAESTEFIDTNLEYVVSYDYRVRAISTYGSSAFSNIGSAKTNSKPSGSDFGVELMEDNFIAFRGEDFVNNFSDSDIGDELIKIEIQNLSPKGSLRLNGLNVSPNDIIFLSQLNDLEFHPSPNENGTTSFTFFYNDGKDNSSASGTVTILILPVNDAPVFSEINDQVLENGEKNVFLTFTVTDIDNIPSEISTSAESNNQELIRNENIVIIGSGTSKSLKVTPEANAFGEAQITLSASDGLATSNATFKLTVDAVTSVFEPEFYIKNYPNPIKSELTISMNGVMDYDPILIIRDFLGRVIIKIFLNRKESIIDLRDVSSGFYELSIFDDEGKLVHNEKIVKN